MHTVDNYERQLETKIIEKFKNDFFEKMGYYPIIFSKYTLNKYNTSVISLDDLNELFNEFLPKNLGIKNITLRHKCRSKKMVELRMIFSFLARSMNYTLKEIGNHFNRHHTSVLHSLQNFNDFMETDPNFKKLFDKINSVYKLKLKSDESSTMDEFDKVSIEPEPTVLLRLLQIQDKTFSNNRRRRRIQNSET